MFAINKEAKVVWASTGQSVTMAEFNSMSVKEQQEYGRTCIVALERDYQPEKKKEFLQ